MIFNSFSILPGHSPFLLVLYSFQLPHLSWFVWYMFLLQGIHSGGLFLSIILSSIVLCRFSGCLSVYPTIFHLLFLIVSIYIRSSPTILTISWLLFQFIQLIICMYFQHHISNAFNVSLLVLFITHVLQSYWAILQIYVLMSLFLMLRSNFLYVTT